MTTMSDAEWQHLYENFETADLLAAVDAVDSLRDDLNDRDHDAPPAIRDDLLKLHQLAMAVVNNGARDQAHEFFDLAGALDDQVSGMMESLEQIRDTLAQIMQLYPESMVYDDPADAVVR